MKIECKKNELEKAVLKASRLTSKHLTLPVLSCVYFETVGENKSILKATNLDVGIEIEIKSKNKEDGHLAIPANVFLGVLSSIKEEDVLLESNNNNLKIITKNNTSIINCMQSDDFPVIPKLNITEPIKIKYNEILMGFKSVWYSASNSSIKPELGSIFVYPKDGTLVFASTDSFRLAEKVINTKSSIEFPQTLIPYKNAVEITKIFEDGEDEILVYFEKNQASFMVKNTYVVSRLIDGSFPDYKQIIPKDFVCDVVVLKNELINSIKTSNIFSDNLNQIKIKTDSKNNRIIIESKNNDVGEYTESIKASVSGEDLELNFNSKYIVDSMQSIVSESVMLSFGGVGKPMLIKGVSDKSFLYIVMPMNR